MDSAPLIRNILAQDAAEIARLSAQLGYPADVDVFAARLRRIAALPTHAVLVASSDTPGAQLCGFIGVEQRLMIESGERVEIVGLVVDGDARRSGVGRSLVAAAEEWARARGVHEVFLRSNIVRPEAHDFYAGIGYTRTKTQHAYQKHLD